MSEIQHYKKSAIKKLKQSDFSSAIELLNQYLKYQSNDIEAFELLGDAYIAIKNNKLASKSYENALALDPKHTTISLKLSRALLAGVDYIQALAAIHQHVKPLRYIEIGVCKGVSFSLAHSDTIAIGVDPKPQIDLSLLPKKHTVISETSDDYFANGRIEKDLGGQPFDMAFLDGMHLFEYALRDFIHLEKYSHSDSIVFIHDLYPLNKNTAARKRFADFWSGDVWKLALCLKEYRPDLTYSLLPCPPTGLGVVTRLDAESTVLQDNYDAILEKYIDMSYNTLEGNKQKKLSLTDMDHPLLNV